MISINSEFTIPYTNQSSNITNKMIYTFPDQYFSINDDSNQLLNHNEFCETLISPPNFKENIHLDNLISIFKIKDEKDKMLTKKHSIKYFETNKKKERGRQRKEETKTKKIISHDKYSFDNLLTKIQAHFLTFVIDLSNEALKTEFGSNTPYNFKYITYGIKKKINFDYLDKIKNTSIKDILQMKISTKFKTFDEDINKQTLKKIKGQSNWLDEFFNMKYMEAFKYYYNNREAPLEKVEFKAKIIDLSNSKIKSIYNLLKKDKVLKNHLIDTINTAYFNDKKYNKIGNSFVSFVTNKIEIDLNI